MKMHEFALFYPELSPKQQDQLVTIHDKELILRLSGVLRLSPGDSVRFFNRACNALFTLTVFKKKEISGKIGKVHTNKKNAANITCLLPVLKKDSLETAVYGLTEMGVQDIQLVITQKVQRKWGGEKELIRLTKILVAAAEQAKNFSFPSLQEPQSLLEVLKESDVEQKLFFDPSGQSVQLVFCKKENPGSVMLLVGPEGDLTDQEKEILRQNNFTFCSLTPTVLRACTAITLAAGIVSSFIHE